jgi:dTDP-4-dehydrorhamnose 3,5-epimerase
MKVIDIGIQGLLLIEPNVFRDERGYFVENWQAERYLGAGIDLESIQDNHSKSSQGTLRGPLTVKIFNAWL